MVQAAISTKILRRDFINVFLIYLCLELRRLLIVSFMYRWIVADVAHEYFILSALDDTVGHRILPSSTIAQIVIESNFGRRDLDTHATAAPHPPTGTDRRPQPTRIGVALPNDIVRLAQLQRLVGFIAFLCVKCIFYKVMRSSWSAGQLR